VLAVLLCTLCGCSTGTTTSPTTTVTAPTTDTFASLLVRGGSTSRAFTTSTAGTVRVTLTAFGNGGVQAGVAVGVPAGSGPCSPAVSVVTAPGGSPQITTSADAGSYCVQVFDPGTLAADTPFTITIEHP